MLDICHKLFSNWNSQDIKYCHWKSNEHLMEGLDGLTDLDVYADINQLAEIETSLKSFDFIKFVPQKGCRYTLVDEWIGFDYTSGNLVHLHLHYQVITGTKFCKEYVFPINSMLIESRVLDSSSGVYVANPNLELIILYSRIVLKSKSKHFFEVKEFRREIDYLHEKCNLEQLKSFCSRCFSGNEELMYRLLCKHDLTNKEWRIVFKIVSAWLKPFKKSGRLLTLVRSYYYRLRYLILFGLNKLFGKCYVVRKTLPGQAISVCFIGQDGSGKSTLTSLICKWLNWKIEAHRFYLGSGDHYNGVLKRLLPKAAKAAYKVSGNNQTTSAQDSTSHQGLSLRIIKGVSRLLNSISLKNIAARAYREVLKADIYRKKKGIALFDRFPQNQFPALYDGPKIRYNYVKNDRPMSLVGCLARREESLIDRAQLYQPDLVFKLVLPVEESMRRKPEENEEQVRRKAAITEKLVFDNSKVFVVDATQDFDEEVLYVKRHIWEEIVNRN